MAYRRGSTTYVCRQCTDSILQRPQALIGTLRGDAAKFGATIDFSVFIEALIEIGFRADNKQSTTDVVVLWAPPQFGETAQNISISRPPSPTEWPADEQAIVAEQLQERFGLVPGICIRFNGALAYGSAIFIEADD
ncbi:hypothetical protein NUW54_g13061 [Trametes sanguinea]|uniref:Uncharacterized protein n=1 Tax=Trametes sanguinea TaxID=158606 RepID=A0ACC1MQR8_9APHY|nr:hypothetical protein NUW54_g13061 [Trametes sanguinea]